MNQLIQGQYFFKDRTLKSINFFNGDSVENAITVYDVFRIEDGIALFIEDHLERLENSFAMSGIEPWKNLAQIRAAIQMLVNANSISNGNIRLSFILDSCQRKSFLMYFLPTNYPTKLLYENGISTVTQEGVRENPNAKIANSEVRKQANKMIEDKHVYETLLMNESGCITEGSRSNLFFVQGSDLYTAPDAEVLCGVIRKQVIKTIEETGYKIHFTCVTIDHIKDMDAAFITGTSPRLLPIKSINQQPFNVDHPVINTLMEKLNNKIQRYKEEHTALLSMR